MGLNIKRRLQKVRISQTYLGLAVALCVGIVGVTLTHSLLAATPTASVEAEAGSLSGNVTKGTSSDASAGSYVRFGKSTDRQALYAENLAKINAQPWRNTMQDGSKYANWSAARLDQDVSVLFGAKKDYDDDRVAEQLLFADPKNGNVRTGCEFSHFAYDDPIVYPGQPEVSHLHMFFGNTDTNAYTTWDSLHNSGSGTCNGGELNRTGYWVPAMFDEKGNVRIPHFMNIYYKNYLMGSDMRVKNNQTTVETYPDDPRLIANKVSYKQTVDGKQTTVSNDVAGYQKESFMCIGEYGGDQSGRVRYLNDLKAEIDKGSCQRGDRFYGPYPEKHYLEQDVLFPNCWNGKDAADPSNYTVSRYNFSGKRSTTDNVPGYYGGTCPVGYDHHLPNITYRIRYILEPGDDPSKWFLSSDVDRATLQRAALGGVSNHGDWWGAWDKKVNKTWVDTCSNKLGASCGFGYLDGKSLEEAPNGPALKYRHKNVYNTPYFTKSSYGCDGVNAKSYLCTLKNVPNNYGCQEVIVDMNQDDVGHPQSKKFCSIDKVPAQDVFNSLCSVSYKIERSSQAAYCRKPAASQTSSSQMSMPMSHGSM